MGDSLPAIHQRYPHLRLYGADVSKTAIERAQAYHGSIARFILAGFDDIEGHYDIILCSNILEHFEDHVDIARRLLSHCCWLYVLAPYNELRAGKPLTADRDHWHVATITKRSFDQLLTERAAARIQRRIVFKPELWLEGLSWWERVKSRFQSQRYPPEYRQILFEISSIHRTGR